MLKQDSSVPLYKQLSDIIRQSIDSGELKSGDKIPTEIELSNMYNISRITVRKAISDLVQLGVIVKKQGKGTFVNMPKIERKIQYLLSFTEACKANGLTVTNKILKKEVIDADPEDKKSLKLDDDDKLVYIQRLRCTTGDPLMLENNYFSFKKYKFLLNEDLDGSLYELLAKKYQITPSDPENSRKDKTSIEIVKASKTEHELLNVPIGEPLFYIKTLIVDSLDQPIHIGKQYVIGERYKFVLS